jgi:titin
MRRPRIRGWPRFLPGIEALEDRIALSTYVVNTTQDLPNPVGSTLSLRAAIKLANLNPGLNVITFNLGSGTQVITLLSDLPAVTNPLVINGLMGPSRVVLDGVADLSGNGLELAASNCAVEGLSVIRFKNYGIQIDLVSSNDLIALNFLGTNFLGQTGLGNGIGLVVQGSANTVRNNAIGDNTGAGVFVPTGSGNTFTANPIQSNGGPGMSLYLASGNTIGGTAPGAGNTILFNTGDGLLANQSTNNQIVGNEISNNVANGVELESATTTLNQVTGNFIGTDASGTVAEANGADGVRIDSGASNNTLQGNVVSANKHNGVELKDTGTTLNQVTGNFIGTDGSGTIALGNGGSGVRILSGPSNNTVQGNVLSANKHEGVDILGAATTGNMIIANKIGTKAQGTKGLGNGDHGILIGGPSNTVAFNLVSANKQNGVVLGGVAATGNQVYGNFIGTNLAGTAALGNSEGVVITGGADNNAVHNNLLSGNKLAGMEIQGGGPLGNRVTGNFIGTNAAGSTALGNGQVGLLLDDGATFNKITANLVSGNGGTGVELRDTGTANNVLQTNFIGTNFFGTGALPNNGDGVLIDGGATVNQVGTGTASGANLISGNAGSGVELRGGNTEFNTVSANLIGTDVSGEHALGNQADGVLLDLGTAQNFIGPGDLISGNGGAGVRIRDAGTQENKVVGDLIGTDITGKAKVPNADGVIINGALVNNIGLPTEGNVISGNTAIGVLIENSATGNTVQANLIGTDITGGAPLGNGGPGVYVILGASFNTIGGAATGPSGAPDPAANTIAFNGGTGVVVGSTPTDTTFGDDVMGNSIFSNGIIGIDLGNDGPTANTPGGPHLGPNGLQNYPVIQSAFSGLGETDITFTLNSAANAQFTVEFFANSPLVQEPPGVFEGKLLVGEFTVTTDGSGNASAMVRVPYYLGLDFLTATATGTDGTSEFSLPVFVVPVPVVRGAGAVGGASSGPGSAVAPALVSGSPTGPVLTGGVLSPSALAGTFTSSATPTPAAVPGIALDQVLAAVGAAGPGGNSQAAGLPLAGGSGSLSGRTVEGKMAAAGSGSALPTNGVPLGPAGASYGDSLSGASAATAYLDAFTLANPAKDTADVDLGSDGSYTLGP